MTPTNDRDKKTSARRLLLLADHLDTLPKKRFYYGSWVGDDWKGKADLSCGTTACALGWATTIPSFRRLGLRMTSRRPPSYADLVAGADLDGYVTAPGCSRSLSAAQDIFKLSYIEAEFLFIPGGKLDSFPAIQAAPANGATAKQVARHIRRFVARFRN